ncbi:MutL C terminal dimerization domain-containing protein, partial [Amylocystis lapponica]
EVIRTADGEETSLRFDLPRISATWGRLQTHVSAASAPPVAAANSSIIKDAGIANAEDDGKAAEALSRVIAKADFATMDVVGQFNLGFIIVRRRKQPASTGGAEARMDDLFIVDQHAADEKYNFETLQQTTKIDSQKLFRPRPLELTAADALLATENMDVLRQNGFELDVDEDAAPGGGHRLQLRAQPISKSTVFDMKDLEELLGLMQDRPTGQMVRCSKARAMFAMRACRKSIMVGKALTRQQMTAVVRHMGTMDQPWHCPHGRPTARHLSDIVGMERGWRAGARAVDWGAFGSSS